MVKTVETNQNNNLDEQNYPEECRNLWLAVLMRLIFDVCDLNMSCTFNSREYHRRDAEYILFGKDHEHLEEVCYRAGVDAAWVRELAIAKLAEKRSGRRTRPAAWLIRPELLGRTIRKKYKAVQSI